MRLARRCIPVVRGEPETNTEVRVTNSTESSVIIASVQTSHSFSIGENSDVTTSAPFMASSTKFRTTTSFTGTTEKIPESEGRPPKHLDTFPGTVNTNDKNPRPFRDEESRPRIETLFDIEINTKNQTVIAVDAKLDSLTDISHVEDLTDFLPPGYKTEEEVLASRKPPTSTTTAAPTSTSKPKVEEVSEATSAITPTERGEPSSTSELPSKSTSIFALFPAVQPTTEPSTDILKGIKEVNVASFLPPGFKLDKTETSTKAPVPSTTESTTVVIPEVKTVDPSLFLPPGYTPEPTTEATTKIIPVVHTVDPSSFLPPGFKASDDKEEPAPVIKTVDISQFLPPGYSVTQEPTTEATTTTTKKLPVMETVDISKFLPPGYKLDATTEAPEIQTVDISKFLPPGYEASTTESPLPSIATVKTLDISQFLPPGYKLSTSEAPSTEKPSTSKPFDISQFLPPGYKFSTTEEPTTKKPVAQIPDISQFLPPGYKLNETAEKEEPEIGSVDISQFLPPGYKIGTDNTPPEPTTAAPTTTTKKSGPKGLVFPRRPKLPAYLTTTLKPVARTPAGPPPVKVTFRNLWDSIKTTTEFTGWKTTEPPVPIRKAPQTPSGGGSSGGVCGAKCRLAATLRITNGTEWRPELANRDTLEWQDLANTIEIELDSLYRRSQLAPWYEGVEIDAFNPGSVLVDYILHLTDIADTLDTTDLKEILNQEIVDNGSYFLGNYTLDPKGTDFIVMHERVRVVQEEEDGYPIPQWLIAVIVIGLASLLFILIFGITVLVNRARVKKRHDVTLTAEMLNELNKNQLAGVDNYAMDGLYDMDAIWNEKIQDRRSMKPPSSRGKGYNPNYNINIYDSWRTDWSGPYGSSATYAKRRPDTNF
ncbi:hypothetical protein E2C01_017067 [Portunus trituberculatus]|uniref:SEA domain-containing protein n=1 Tax=Portunus trituberculatus TaxID=210409 RepID=A0A5B7DST6_PORTR|nr:hypothetical protein [Portunus trituberculatus]